MKYLRHPFKYDDQAAASRIDNAGLFQHRQQLRRLVERLTSSVKHNVPYLRCVHFVGQRLTRPFGRYARNGENGAFRRLHNSLICRFDAPFQRVNQIPCIRLLPSLQPARKSTEQKR